MNPETPELVSVCICTFRRPELLSALLDSIVNQVPDPAFRVEVVIVDNDRQRSAEPVARRFERRAHVAVVYDCEPEQNISLARNRAIRNASGSLVAFLDDDERPVQGWLTRLYQTFRTHAADGVLGPVLPDYPAQAPGWLKKGRFFDRRRLPTGSRISERDARTGNVLLLRSIFTEHEGWFDPAFGRTGGEDSDFFRRQFECGRTFVWCDEAEAYETVPPDRWTTAFHVRRFLRSGTIDGELMRAGRIPSSGPVFKSIILVGVAVVIAPLSLLLRKDIRVRVWQKLAYSGGVVAAFSGASLLRDRD